MMGLGSNTELFSTKYQVGGSLGLWLGLGILQVMFLSNIHSVSLISWSGFD